MLNQREYEARIYELEKALENVLELFPDQGVRYEIEVLMPQDASDGTGTVLEFCEVPEETVEVLEAAAEVLWGGDAELVEV